MVLARFFVRCLRFISGKGNTIWIGPACYVAISQAAAHFSAMALANRCGRWTVWFGCARTLLPVRSTSRSRPPPRSWRPGMGAIVRRGVRVACGTRDSVREAPNKQLTSRTSIDGAVAGTLCTLRRYWSQANDGTEMASALPDKELEQSEVMSELAIFCGAHEGLDRWRAAAVARWDVRV